VVFTDRVDVHPGLLGVHSSANQLVEHVVLGRHDVVDRVAMELAHAEDSDFHSCSIQLVRGLR
jgi:hypothetical protein